jgi:lipoate-protein ligase B
MLLSGPAPALCLFSCWTASPGWAATPGTLRRVLYSLRVRQLEGIGIELLKTLSVTVERSKGQPGLWIGEKKIASLGVKVKRHITYHGMAINLTNDLAIFNNIVPCGIENVRMTSAERQIQTPIDMEKAKQTLADIIMSLWA